MIKDITIGQFFPGKSAIHRLDPRIKLVLTVGLIVFVFVANTAAAITLMTLGVAGTMALTRVPIKLYFKGLRPILIIVVFTSILNIFYFTQGHVLLDLGFVKITDQGLLRSLLIAVRIACMILISCILTYTTSPTQLTDALERLLSPLKVLHVKVHEIAMMMTIALRFVPTLLEETDKIMNAQKARGADMESGGLMQRMRAMIPILIPLFVSAFRRAFELAIAMECRCYHGGDGRTRMRQLHMQRLDFIAVGLAILLCAGVILCNIYIPPAL